MDVSSKLFLETLALNDPECQSNGDPVNGKTHTKTQAVSSSCLQNITEQQSLQSKKVKNSYVQSFVKIARNLSVFQHLSALAGEIDTEAKQSEEEMHDIFKDGNFVMIDGLIVLAPYKERRRNSLKMMHATKTVKSK